MENTANQILLTGVPDSMPVFSHTNHERKFYHMMLAVERLSGTVDVLPVLLAEDILEGADLTSGRTVTVAGQIRSFNSRLPTGRRLIICVYATSVFSDGSTPQNEAALQGTICRAPLYRRTPLGREITDLMLAVPRPYRRSDYIPAIIWGRNARQAAALPVGTQLQLEGRLQSRKYIKLVEGESQERTTYEFSVNRFSQD